MNIARIHEKVKNLRERRSVRIVGYVLSLLMLTGGLLWSIKGINFARMLIDYSSGGLALVLSMLWVQLSAERFRALALSLGACVSRFAAFRVIVTASIANMLPVPGNFIVRWYALRSQVGDRKSIVGNLGVMILWVAVVMAAASGGFFVIGLEYVAWTLLVLSVAAILAFLVIHQKLAVGKKMLYPIILLQLAITAAYILRLWLLSDFAGLEIGLAVCAIISLSALAGSASGIFPAGMGIVEVFGAILAALIQVMPEKAFLLLALSRVSTLLALLAGLLFVRLFIRHIPESSS